MKCRAFEKYARFLLNQTRHVHSKATCQILRFYQRAEQVIEHKSDDNTKCDWCRLNSPKGLEKETGGTGD